MGKILEILGRALTLDISELIWDYIEQSSYDQPDQGHTLGKIARYARQGKDESAQNLLRLYQFEYSGCVRAEFV